MDTKNRIIEYLKINEAASVDGLSRSLGLTKADIRYHLKYLLKDGVVRIHSEKKQQGRGRPAANFHAISALSPELYTTLLNTLVEVTSSNDLPESFRRQFTDLVVSRLVVPAEVSESPAILLSKRIEHLSRIGFVIHWEAGPTGPIIHMYSEPITTAITNHELSGMILSKLLCCLNGKSLV